MDGLPGRYVRQQAVEGLDAARLAALHVVVVGAGAVGNEVVKNLALMGVGRIDVHDFDRVEVHNLTRSIFLREADVGTPKARAVAMRAAEVDPNVAVRAIEGDAWRTLRLATLAGCDALVAAVDSLEARMRLAQLAMLARVGLVSAGIDSRHACVEWFPHAQDDGACYECHLPASAYQRIAARHSCGWLRRALAKDAVVPTTAITASVAGALAVQAVLRQAPSARRVLLDTRTGSSTVTALERNDACVGCGPLRPRPVRVPAAGDWRAALARYAPQAAHVLLAEALIFDAACVGCGAPAAGEACTGRRAADFDDGIMRCPACGELAVRVDVRAEATIDELAARYGAAAPPVKYLLAHAGEAGAVCIDLED